MAAISGNEREMPKYTCHKQVWALKIKATKALLSNPQKMELTFEDSHFVSMAVSMNCKPIHRVKVGGYFVVYEDGYQSFSPAEAFEKGYTLTGDRKFALIANQDLEKFIQALNSLKYIRKDFGRTSIKLNYPGLDVIIEEAEKILSDNPAIVPDWYKLGWK